MLLLVVECSLNLPITFSSDVWTWRRQGIGFFSSFSFDLTNEVRVWLKDHVGEVSRDWWWDHFREEGETAIMFVDPAKAMMFKLVWL